MDKYIAEIAKYWLNAKKTVVFSGAGMSTDSGLPDFRSAQGLWKLRPESLATMKALRTMPDEAYYFYQWRIDKLWGIKPNKGHEIIARLQAQGLVSSILTQNVDGLHQRAGNTDVIELHGTLSTVSCISCQAVYDSRQLLPTAALPASSFPADGYKHGMECYCPKCQGMLRPDVVLFGEQLPQLAWERSMSASQSADLFVALGSSLVVSPANYCPEAAVSNNAKLLIVNNEPTPLDELATWVIRKNISSTLEKIYRVMFGLTESELKDIKHRKQ